MFRSVFLAALVLAAPNAGARPAPRAMSFAAIKEFAHGCGIRTFELEEPNMLTTAQVLRRARHGEGRYTGKSGPGESADASTFTIELIGGAVQYIYYAGRNRAEFDRCATRLVDLAFPRWPDRQAWFAHALETGQLPISHPGPEHLAVQDGLYVQATPGFIVEITTAAGDRANQGWLAKQPALRVPTGGTPGR